MTGCYRLLQRKHEQYLQGNSVWMFNYGVFFLTTVKFISYLCVWWPQIYKTRMTLLTNSILYMKWNKNVIMNARERKQGRKEGNKKEGRMGLKKSLRSWCSILWVQTKPRLWLQLDVTMNWRGFSFMYVQLSFEKSTFSAHKHTQTHH